MQTVADIKKRLSSADEEEFGVLKRALCADTRKGVVDALVAARRRLDAERAEKVRLESMYTFENELSEGRVVVGLDEVGRGPLAGPLAVGAVVLPADCLIEGLDDSKKIPESRRALIAAEIKEHALAWTVQYIEADEIDAAGMSLCLKMAFSRAVRAIEDKGIIPEIILLDGNPLRLDEREINVIKGDGRCASIAAASIVAKVARDELMSEYALQYPQYAFDRSKGYASPDHIEAIKSFGLTPLHRVSFCSSFLQESLF